MSIWTWKEGSVAQGVAQTVRQVVTNPAQEAASWSAVWLPILMMYSPVQVVCTVFSLSFMLLPASFAAALWVGGLAVYYAVTLPGAPEHTGQHRASVLAALTLYLHILDLYKMLLRDALELVIDVSCQQHFST